MAATIKTDCGIILPVDASSHIWGSVVYLLRKGTLAAKLDLLFEILLTQLKLSQGNRAFQIPLEEKQLEGCHEKLSRREEQGEGELAPHLLHSNNSETQFHC